MDDFCRNTKACESLREGIGEAFEALEKFRFIDHMRVIVRSMIIASCVVAGWVVVGCPLEQSVDDTITEFGSTASFEDIENLCGLISRHVWWQGVII